MAGWRFATTTSLLVCGSGAHGSGIAYAQYRKRYADNAPADKLQPKSAADFAFRRFQSIAAVKQALSDCRSERSFKPFSGKDGRKGHICTAKRP